MQPSNPSLSSADDFTAPESAATTVEAIASHIDAIIRLLGEDPSREGLVKTPMRAARALYYLTDGYRGDVDKTVNGAVFTSESDGMVVVRDIEFYSMCEHHILPFFGTVSIGYLPRGKVLGLSKFGRLVDLHARRLQLQERLTRGIAREIALAADTEDVIVYCEASHMCMRMRGVEKELSETATIETMGRFATDASLRSQFFAMLRHNTNHNL